MEQFAFELSSEVFMKLNVPREWYEQSSQARNPKMLTTYTFMTQIHLPPKKGSYLSSKK